MLTEAQVQALEKKQEDDVAHGEIETAHLGGAVQFELGKTKPDDLVWIIVKIERQ